MEILPLKPHLMSKILSPDPHIRHIYFILILRKCTTCGTISEVITETRLCLHTLAIGFANFTIFLS